MTYLFCHIICFITETGQALYRSYQGPSFSAQECWQAKDSEPSGSLVGLVKVCKARGHLNLKWRLSST